MLERTHLALAGSRWSLRLMAVAGLAGALAAIALPAHAETAEIAAVLAMGALALLAGHDWGLAVVVVADVLLLGRLGPLVVHDWPPGPMLQLAVYTALAGALPGLFVLRRALPGALELVLGRACSARAQRASVIGGVALSAVWLVWPFWALA